MEKAVIKVGGISCEHCVRAITTAVGALGGIGSVCVDIKVGVVTVEYDPSQSPLDKIKAAIAEQGYEMAL